MWSFSSVILRKKIRAGSEFNVVYFFHNHFSLTLMETCQVWQENQSWEELR